MTRKERLERLRQKLIERREELRTILSGSVGGAAGSSTGDEGDVATIHSADELETRLASHLSDELNKVESALRKFNEGLYGICEMTNMPIPIARLEALPYTNYSIEAQRLIEEEGYEPEDRASDQHWARAVEQENRLSDREGLSHELNAVDD